MWSVFLVVVRLLVIVVFCFGLWFCWSAYWKIFFRYDLWDWARNFTLWFISMDFVSLVVGNLCFTGFVLVMDYNSSSFLILIMSDNGYVSNVFLDFLSMMNKFSLFCSCVS